MDIRKYNIFLNLHTVSGIVLSMLMYVIFFAGSFSFFRDEIVNWERADEVHSEHFSEVDIDQTLRFLNDTIPLRGRDVTLSKHYREKRISVDISSSKDSLLGEAESSYFFYLDTDSQKSYSYDQSYSLGEFLYRLHFFAQIPYPIGYHLSGLTAVFLIFVLLTGILVHWKKIISNFFLFRPRAKLKTLWTDLHTVLGTIGIPFQMLYAITGALFMLKALLFLPKVAFLYDGDRKEMFSDLYGETPTYEYGYLPLDKMGSVDEHLKNTKDEWQDFHVNKVKVSNYGDESMHLMLEGELDYSRKLVGKGRRIFDAGGKVVAEKSPYDQIAYPTSVVTLVHILHFGNYGGLLLRLISFVLGIASCFVVISGIMIWLEARKNKRISDKRRRFNAKVGYIYLAFCLTMYPVTALSFLFSRLLPAELGEARKSWLCAVYFPGWLIFTIFFAWKKDNRFTNKFTLILGGLLGLLIPVVDLLMLPNMTLLKIPDLLLVNLLWIVIGGVTLWIGWRLKRPVSI